MIQGYINQRTGNIIISGNEPFRLEITSPDGCVVHVYRGSGIDREQEPDGCFDTLSMSVDDNKNWTSYPQNCARCGSDLHNDRCTDETCPFSDCSQDNPQGWAGHDRDPNSEE